MNLMSNTAASYSIGYWILDKKLQYCSSDSCCINKRSYEPLRNHESPSWMTTWPEPKLGGVGFAVQMMPQAKHGQSVITTETVALTQGYSAPEV